MQKFIVEKLYSYLKIDVQGFYYANWKGQHSPETPKFIYKLKNDPHHNWSDEAIRKAKGQLYYILLEELPKVQECLGWPEVTVCVVPRAKAEQTYRDDQLLFRQGVQDAVRKLGYRFIDGTKYIRRHTNTKTTHLRNGEVFNDGAEPYPGIAKDTCYFSSDIANKKVLLIDDIYTKTVNIDEDMLQALLDNGAHAVAFYSIGRTVFNNDNYDIL